MSAKMINASSWDDLRPHYEELFELPLNTAEEAEAWLRQRDSIDEYVDEEHSTLYIATTTNTADKDSQEKQRHFVSEVMPELHRMSFRLDQHFVDSPGAQLLTGPTHEVYLRNLRADVALFREENVAIEAEEQQLSRKFNQLAGDLKFVWDGQEVPMMQVYAKTEEPDRSVREKAWRTMFGGLLEHSLGFQELVDDLIKLRHKIAVNAGFDNFRDYMYKKLHRFDYGPEHCAEYRKSVAELIMPLSRRLDDERRQALGLEKLRPWDVRAEPIGRDPLRPFTDADELIAKTSEIFKKIDPKLSRFYDTMKERQELDLASRLNKSPGGYHTFRAQSRRPFIFMNAAGTQRDVMTLLHESGHAFHSLHAVDQPLLAYRHSPREFAELAAMGMEMIALPHLAEFYDEADYKRAVRSLLAGTINTLCSVAMVDGLQDWFYLNPDHTHEERNAYWRDLTNEFGGDTDDSGVEHLREVGWELIPHIYRQPFYYFEYAVAQLGALQLWQRAQEDQEATLRDYCRALELGGSRPLPELFETAGLRFDFSPETISKLVKAVEAKLEELPFA